MKQNTKNMNEQYMKQTHKTHETVKYEAKHKKHEKQYLKQNTKHMNNKTYEANHKKT